MLSTVPEHLKKPLDKYFRDYPKVKVVRSEERGGLTRARLLGCQASGGEVLVFLDSHIECTKGQRASTAGYKRSEDSQSHDCQYIRGHGSV